MSKTTPDPELRYGKLVDVDGRRRVEFSPVTGKWHAYVRSGADARWEPAGQFDGSEADAIAHVNGVAISTKE